MLAFFNTVLGAATSGTVLGFVKLYLQMKHEQEIAKIKLENKSIQDARLVSSTSMQAFRMIVILVVCIAYFSKPFLAAYMDWPMWISYTQTHGWFVSIFSGSSSTILKEFHGLVNSPTDNEVLVFVMTFLFGSVRVSRMR